MQSGQEVVYLHLDDIIPNRFQPREVFDERALKELAASIKEHGVIQPIIVRQVNNKYEIIAGERRYKASALAGMTKIPAIVNNLDDKEAAKVALLENLQRKNLNPIEEARTYQKILELDQMTQDSLAKTMGKSQSAVANKLRLLSLPDEIQLALLKEEISERHARTLLNIDDIEKQKEFLKRIINEKMSVRNLEEEIKKYNSQKNNGGAEMNNSLIDTNSIVNVPQQQQVPLMQENQISNQVPNLMESFNASETNSNNNNQMPMQQLNNEQNTSIPEASNVENNGNLNINNNVVNYGNIDEDEIQNENIKFDDNNKSTAGQTIDINDMKANTVDIDQIISQQQNNSENNDNNEKISNELDSLLNIKNPEQSGFNPMKELINESNEDNNKDDYFQAPDLMSIQLPNATNNINSVIDNGTQQIPGLNNIPLQNNNSQSENNQSMNDFTSINNKSFFNNSNPIKEESNKNNIKTLGMALMEETYNLPKKEVNTNSGLSMNQMIDQIRKTVQMLERNGAKIDTDEIDFENQYQIVIRIDKNN